MSLFPILVGLLFSLGVSLIMTPLAIKAGHRFRLLDMPGQHKRHKRPTPFLGGAALFICMWVTIFATSLCFPGLFGDLFGSLFYILVGALIILLVGLSDDLSPVSAWIKLGAQVAAALILFQGGLRVDILWTPLGVFQIGSVSVLLTVLWVVGLTNAINLIDGLDGLAAGVSLIGAVTMVVVGQLYRIGPVLIFVWALAGFLVVFLYYNRHPARLFLGDSGSMQLGYYFAVFSLVFPLKSYTAAALYVPLLALGVPILETLSSFGRRLASGKNIMKADRRHLFHYLSLAGLSPRQVVLVFYALAAVFGGFALAMFFWNRRLVFGILVAFMVVIFALFFILMTNLFPRKRFDRSRGFESRHKGV
ncbi:MAG: undecaprenyl/decaprenyl-phosphate alpha-N-acetylglucosaminyl 1-phosphate transferase [candidate division Zixibacteria bacterium]|nr:undecaprenyl/decaprenyl-phosphate alpha-N-acetylglucosaminyl 1-phosphate transferase [candidate division Zixibacteria bacterium]